jgi:hypothetical protein
MENEKNYSSSEIMELTEVSRQTLLRLRKGTKFKALAGKGEKKEYIYDPIMTKPEDFFWQKGKIVYTEAGLKKILDYKANGEYWKRQL